MVETVIVDEVDKDLAVARVAPARGDAKRAALVRQTAYLVANIAVRSDELVGARASALKHEVRDDAMEGEAVIVAVLGEPDALDSIRSTVAQLEANEADLGAMRLGPQLTFDPKAERFVGTDAAGANNLLRYEMRKEFAIPDKI